MHKYGCLCFLTKASHGTRADPDDRVLGSSDTATDLVVRGAPATTLPALAIFDINHSDQIYNGPHVRAEIRAKLSLLQ